MDIATVIIIKQIILIFSFIDLFKNYQQFWQAE
jgi:hypothetical protein